MKAVMLSIQPKWCEKIASGEKTVEVRKTRPKIETPFPCYIYCTQQRVNGEILLTREKKVEGRNRGFREQGDIPLAGKVIGEFVCDRIGDMRDIERDPTCLSIEEWLKYTDGHKGIVYGWHISDLVIYDTPKELSEFFKACDKPPRTDCSKCIDQRQNTCKSLSRPPMSWCYVEVQE